MKKRTRAMLWITFAVVGVCMPTVVALEIVQNGNWWVMFYLAWAVAIELFILMLLGRGRTAVLGGEE